VNFNYFYVYYLYFSLKKKFFLNQKFQSQQHTTHNTQHTTHNTQHTTHNTQHRTKQNSLKRDLIWFSEKIFSIPFKINVTLLPHPTQYPFTFTTHQKTLHKPNRKPSTRTSHKPRSFIRIIIHSRNLKRGKRSPHTIDAVCLNETFGYMGN
jgi:hypothetical protein